MNCTLLFLFMHSIYIKEICLFHVKVLQKHGIYNVCRYPIVKCLFTPWRSALSGQFSCASCMLMITTDVFDCGLKTSAWLRKGLYSVLLTKKQNICDKIIMWNKQRKQKKKWRERKEKRKIMNTKQGEQYLIFKTHLVRRIIWCSCLHK